MPLYILKRTDEVHYDEYEAKIIRAKNVKEARSIANSSHGDEGRIWNNPIKVKCLPLAAIGESKELLSIKELLTSFN